MSGTERLNAALAGRYKIEKQLGQGGMATVYLAKDIKHDRMVAVKVLKPELAAVLGAERFVVEIKTTAALQHPHILPLFDSGTTAGHPERSEGSFLYYVMPYIEGETLRDKLNRETQFSVDEAVRITTQVADALDYAHRHGVIHRDIKPENILLHDGRPMVADFGIALAVSAAAGGRMTETGLSLGTPHYMSPEQATAEKEISGRSDIYSLASVLFEMLAGEPPHMGGSAQQIIMKIIAEPARSLANLRKTVPPNVAAAVAKALEKLPADRFETAKQFAEALMNRSFTSATLAGDRNFGLRSSVFGLRSVVVASTVAVLATAVAVWSLSHTPTIPDAPVVRVAVDLLPGERLYPSTSGNVAISPQGDRLAYIAQSPAGARLMVRRTREIVAREVTSTVVNSMAFSPDGRLMAFYEGLDVFKVSVDGGPNVVLATIPDNVVRGLYWTTTGILVAGSDRGLMTIAATGGGIQRVAGVDSTAPAVFPVMLSDNNTVAYAHGGALRHIAVTALSTQRTTELDLAATTVLGMRDGHLIYVTVTGELFAVPFDISAQKTTGDPVLLENNVVVSASGQADAALSANGSLWFVSGQSNAHLVRVEPGRADSMVRQEVGAYRRPRLSPNGSKVAVEVSGMGGTNIWVLDFANRTFVPLTTDGLSSNVMAEWTPDGRKLIYRSNREGKQAFWWQPADGSAPAEVLFRPHDAVNEIVVSPDNKWLLYRTAPGLNSRDIFVTPLTGDTTVTALVTGPAQESHMRVSPNGKWLAYQSNESGKFEIYVRPFPNAGPRTPVSNKGGAEPHWSHSGDAIFYRTLSGGIEVASVTSGATFTVGTRRELLSASEYLVDASHASWDVFPDGRSFLMVKPVGGDSRPILVLNWGRELREKLAPGRAQP